jgi:hypothetical protein
VGKPSARRYLTDISQIDAHQLTLGSIVEESIEECEVVHTSNKKRSSSYTLGSKPVGQGRPSGFHPESNRDTTLRYVCRGTGHGIRLKHHCGSSLFNEGAIHLTEIPRISLVVLPMAASAITTKAET